MYSFRSSAEGLPFIKMLHQFLLKPLVRIRGRCPSCRITGPFVPQSCARVSPVSHDQTELHPVRVLPVAERIFDLAEELLLHRFSSCFLFYISSGIIFCFYISSVYRLANYNIPRAPPSSPSLFPSRPPLVSSLPSSPALLSSRLNITLFPAKKWIQASFYQYFQFHQGFQTLFGVKQFLTFF